MKVKTVRENCSYLIYYIVLYIIHNRAILFFSLVQDSDTIKQVPNVIGAVTQIYSIAPRSGRVSQRTESGQARDVQECFKI